VNHVVIKIEDNVRIDTAKLALKGKQVVSQRQDGDGVSEPPERARDVADLRVQISSAAAILRELRLPFRVRVVHHRYVKMLHGSLSQVHAESSTSVSLGLDSAEGGVAPGAGTRPLLQL
jgi:hypothetical protein